MYFRTVFHGLLILFLSCSVQVTAQTTSEIIQSIQQLMLEQYIFLDKAEEVNAHLEQLQQDGYFDAYKAPEDLAGALTREMRKITRDYHLGVQAPQLPAAETPVEQPDPLRGLTRYNPSMINGYQYFEDNVGYFDMRFFGGGEVNLGLLDNSLEKLSKADALIIDLRYSMGGSPSTVQYLCSYFFDEDMLLTSIYSRYNDHTREYRTVEVNGRKRPNVPLFILTSDRTFSAAEGLPYALQSQGRATIVGEVTRGGAHPTRSHSLPGGFRVRIPFARSLNPITQSNWEGVGVIPDVQVPEEEALEKAKELAAAAAEKYRENLFAPLLTALDAVHGKSGSSEAERVYPEVRKMLNNGILSELDINRLGYNYLLGSEREAALLLFEANIRLHPESANAFDSYAEALAGSGERDKALENYKKAVALAKAQNLDNLAVFEQNLAAFERK
ncbi:S41 family peptidase [Flavilitoribacter nigricans]|uniref:Tail specific protease domain-containing protein n=1 Tax=Flavilitoribacter nigricans (strain ATCC 23147 / DSM 23189 / NBRC 102662 / NCIMB 1420 / SS-2) TaxID=1122177 RepID=A0A2D0N7E1_FLAN2|nr:S41 family peptidase [Flavilitoribacter nigricans]PHN04318.1 hypothetical protein CRP01_22410 [Flavilitoribacter nigricans DSM 23189 = NBRC 102662]